MTHHADKTLQGRLNIADILGLAQLAAQAATGLVGVVEGVHQSVRGTLGLPSGKASGQTTGITGLVYQLVRGVTQLADTGASGALALFHRPDAASESAGAESARREKLLAALNGIMGDRLVASRSPFARAMGFHVPDQLKVLDELNPTVSTIGSGKVLLLVHGLCMSDAHWCSAPGGGLGQVLASEHGYTPVYLRYNSGLHISENGMELAGRLEQLISNWPVPVERLVIVGHSMGGLLARSAIHYARQGEMCWPGQLTDLVFLGTPHHGAPLERGGSWLDLVLGSIPYTRPFTALGRVRSAGITDLRHGHVLEEDWQGRDRFRMAPEPGRMVPLPEGVACHAVAATLKNGSGALANHFVGDGLVPVHSALGRHRDSGRSLVFDEPSTWVARHTNHQQLLTSPEVAQKVAQWLA